MDKYTIKLYDEYDVVIEHYKTTFRNGVCYICGKALAGKGEIFIVRSGLFPEATVHRECCHRRLITDVDTPGLTLLALHLENEWNLARRFSMWFR